jgi:hypothetical protein
MHCFPYFLDFDSHGENKRKLYICASYLLNLPKSMFTKNELLSALGHR